MAGIQPINASVRIVAHAEPALVLDADGHVVLSEQDVKRIARAVIEEMIGEQAEAPASGS